MAFITFAEPAHLYLLIPLFLILCGGFVLKWRLSRRFAAFLGGESLYRSLLSVGRARVRGLLLALAAFCMVLAFAGPAREAARRSSNFMALVDISQSMWCRDYTYKEKPLSRLEMAKKNLLSLLYALPAKSRMGLGIFAGSADSVLILTPPRPVEESFEDLERIIRAIHPSWIWDDGTYVAGAVANMGRILKRKKHDYGNGLTLIFLTDGEDTGGLAARSNAENIRMPPGVHLYFAGIGSAGGAPVPELDENWEFKADRHDYVGEFVVSRLDEDELNRLAKTTGGMYRRVAGDSDLAVLAASREFNTGEDRTAIDMSWVFWLAASALVLLFLVF